MCYAWLLVVFAWAAGPEVRMQGLMTPRYMRAGAVLPGDGLFWETVLNQSDVFAFNTVHDGKGGPFGAQLWLVNESQERYVLVGTAEAPEDSNAVVSTGRASAHAEAESLCLENRGKVVGFLEGHRDEGWGVVQVSSGESCPSCRAKQVVFADELIGRGLIPSDGFHVVFKATYEQTKVDAGFNDAPYDQAFRAIAALKLLDSEDGLFGLEAALQGEGEWASQTRTGELVYIPVDRVDAGDVSDEIQGLFEKAVGTPIAVVVRADGSVLSVGREGRDYEGDAINAPERSAIVSALYEAAAGLRAQGRFEAWDLEGACLYTNISSIGPVAYSESLWYNLSGIRVVGEFVSEAVNESAQELPGMGNAELFAQVAGEYDSESMPLRVSFGGDPERASVAHLLWKAKMRMEELASDQGDRLIELGKRGAMTIELVDGSPMAIGGFVKSSKQSSNYDGKQV